MELIPAVTFLLALMVIPESPRYLVVSGQIEKAKAVLSRLYGAEAAALKARTLGAKTSTCADPSGAKEATRVGSVPDWLRH